MSKLKTKFEEARAGLTDKNQSNSAAFVEILHKAMPDYREKGFQPKALKEHGIEPRAFLRAWAKAWVNDTVAYQVGPHDKTWGSTLVARCKTALDTSTPQSFGRYLSQKDRKRIHDKLGPHPEQYLG
ncbi:MAG: hypothetical protein DI551_01295 [Micavibrio aeruginosavorus]|uniref:Uncharacterized protein n=1 Tax=Micavibrio aeruginosavorus TaxID=349221 RepID=A0A2W5Q1L2_9BACT|nr:MAG: hypothetical protein DI551_01295 [Micavibrio aeruginosavorus]